MVSGVRGVRTKKPSQRQATTPRLVFWIAVQDFVGHHLQELLIANGAGTIVIHILMTRCFEVPVCGCAMPFFNNKILNMFRAAPSEKTSRNLALEKKNATIPNPIPTVPEALHFHKN